MDTLSHGLWGGVVFGRSRAAWGQRSWLPFALAVFWGMAPDLLTFGPRFVEWALAGFPDYPTEPGFGGAPALASLPAYVFSAYQVTHSLIIWALAFALLCLIRRRPVWVFAAWGLHILFDIPTHSTRYFPTPFLWPLATPYVNGIAWSRPWFLITNYVLLALLLTVIVWRHRQRRT